MSLTERGFERISYDKFVEQLTERSKNMLGADMDCSETSVYGALLKTNRRNRITI